MNWHWVAFTILIILAIVNIALTGERAFQATAAVVCFAQAMQAMRNAVLNRP